MNIDWKKDFYDFYFEKGKYHNRARGHKEYEKFIEGLLSMNIDWKIAQEELDKKNLIIAKLEEEIERLKKLVKEEYI